MASDQVLVIDLEDSDQYQQLLDGRPQTRGMRSGRVFLQPGQSCGSHSTEAHEELLIFLSGRGVALIGKQEKENPVAAGKVTYIGPYTTHNIKNTGKEHLSYIYCVAPVTE